MQTRQSLVALLCLLGAGAMVTGCAAGEDDATAEDEAEVDDGTVEDSADAIKRAQLACNHYIRLSSGYVNVRTGPGTNYPRLRDGGGYIKLYNGHPVTLLAGDRTNGFFPIQGPTGRFWVAGKYVREACES